MDIINGSIRHADMSMAGIADFRIFPRILRSAIDVFLQ